MQGGKRFMFHVEPTAKAYTTAQQPSCKQVLDVEKKPQNAHETRFEHRTPDPHCTGDKRLTGGSEEGESE